jgi:hypothetical protein
VGVSPGPELVFDGRFDADQRPSFREVTQTTSVSASAASHAGDSYTAAVATTV